MRRKRKRKLNPDIVLLEMASASKEEIRYQLVEKMAGLLADSPTKRFTRRKLFGTKHQSWQARVLKELCETGVIEKGGPGNLPTYQVVNREALDAIVEDEIEISALAWPSSRRQETEETPEPEAAPPDPEEEVSPEKVQELTLKLLAAFVENFSWMRKKMEKMDTELGALRKDVKDLWSAWD